MGPESALHVPSGRIELGHVGPGFAFDNEVGAACIEWPAFEIDARPVSWGRYLTFAHETGHPVPDPLRHDGTQWWIRSGSHWQPLPLSAPATHLSALDAEAWCAWAGRQLPTEAQWSAAVAASGFEWGEVWEWTRTPFAPFQGFVAHPYEDYSAPWWHTHRVLKGASWATPECMVDHRFRNFYLPRRTDLLAGFRTVAAG
jgi:EgtB-related family protein